jgi:ABC-type branched-subunit amino acid transport system ATPase component
VSAAMRLQAHLELPDGHLDLEVAPGEARELPGDPLAVAALLGEDRRRGHRVLLDSRRLERRTVAARVRAGLVAVGEAPVAPEVSVRDHLAAIASRSEADTLLAATPVLGPLGARPAGMLSGGERRLLAWTLARALRPAVVVLDRAATGLDPDALAWTDEVVAAWRADDVGVLVRVGRPEERGWLTASTDG